jgi:hypothetical protein
MGNTCSTNGEERNAYRIFCGKSRRKEHFGKPRGRRANNFMVDLREIGWGGMDWIVLAQDMDQWGALVNTVLVPQNVGKFLSS